MILHAQIRVGGPGAPPPLDLSEVGSCMDFWWIWEGVLRWFYLTLFIFVRLVSPVSNIHRVNIWKILITSKFKGHGTVNPDIIQFTIPGFHESAFPLPLCLKIQDFTPYKPNIFWGPSRPQYQQHIHFALLNTMFFFWGGGYATGRWYINGTYCLDFHLMKKEEIWLRSIVKALPEHDVYKNPWNVKWRHHYVITMPPYCCRYRLLLLYNGSNSRVYRLFLLSTTNFRCSYQNNDAYQFDFEISSRNLLNFEIVEICKLDLSNPINVISKLTTICFNRCVFGR